MLDALFKALRKDETRWKEVRLLFQERVIPPRTMILREGEISEHIYFIKKGCLRMWFNNDGKDVTLQFFFEDQAVASIESYWQKTPSLFNLESIETTECICISKSDVDRLLVFYPELKDGLLEFAFERMSNYSFLFLSMIKDNPRKRYEELLKHHPEIIRRVPLRYIASYLGITPVSLSRIRNRK
jgi:CRP-like cAMP-binding protein